MEEERFMDKRRMFLALLFASLSLAAVLARLFWIQVVDAAHFSARATDLARSSVLQRERKLVLDSGRGQFTDRAGRSLTGAAYPALLVFPIRREEADQQRAVLHLSGVLEAKPEAWRRFVEGLQMPAFWTGGGAEELPARITERQAAAIEAMGLAGVMVTEYRRRYKEPYDAAQLIGYIGQNPERVQTEFADLLAAGRLVPTSEIGAAGLEKTFEPFLRGIGPTSLSLFTDGLGRPLAGLGYRYVDPGNPLYPLNIVTTLDLPLQRRLELAADKAGLKQGSIVVLDAASGDIAAMVSRPRFDPNKVDLKAGGWRNRALKAIIPGSVFKTVVAAAALDKGAAAPGETFECKGKLGKYKLTCWKKEGHGRLTLEEAYAQSCNIAFARVMSRLTASDLDEAAAKLGIGRQIGWNGKVLREDGFVQLDREEAGRVFAGDDSRADEGARLQTAIGQRDVRLTPLQAANMVVTLLNGGELKAVRAVKEIQYRTGRTLARFPAQTLVRKGEGVSAETAALLVEWMKEVTDHGTGKALRGGKWQLAGKSGTAQVEGAGRETTNEWFVGYGPAGRPKYAVAVAVEALAQPQGNEAIELFRQTVDALADGERAS